MTYPSYQSSQGSSPRVRGAAEFIKSCLFFSRIIPARAGSRSAWDLKRRYFRDHPRACGEQVTAPQFHSALVGSSPRVRGAESNQHNVIHTFGIIPARAGSSRQSDCRYRPAWDHPRACGEQEKRLCARPVIEGSSPRVRGAVVSDGEFKGQHRIIPARAGSSFTVSAISASVRDHPRACGEQYLKGYIMDFSKGSSPRVRGAAKAAKAGSILAWDHPRACGEQLDRVNGKRSCAGSSPRVRGAGSASSKSMGFVGIIPARAGSSR